MNQQELQGLQEAYLEVVMNEGLGGFKNQDDYKKREMEFKRVRDEHLEKYRRGELPFQQQRNADQAQEFLKKHPRKKRTQREQVDIYDIILSHLLDEGYAETPESAEVIMVNMSEDWRESIFESVAGDLAARVAARATKLANQRKGQTPQRKKVYDDLAKEAGKRAEIDNPMRSQTGLSRFERAQRDGPQITPATSQAASGQQTLGGSSYQRGPRRLPKGEKYRRQVATGVRAASSQEKKRLGIRENYDIYDIILSHLLDEGYAETPEAAEVIMANMSEDWRESIVEEMTTTHGFIRGTNRPPSAPVLPPPTRGSKRPKPTSSIPKLPPKGTPLGVGWGP